MLPAAQILLLAAGLPSVSAISALSSCDLHAACAGLDGECCPTENGVQLSCCGVTGGHENADLAQAFQPMLEAFRDVSPEKAVPVYAPDAVISIFGMASGRRILLCKGMECHIKYWSALRSRLLNQETGKNIAEYISNTSASGPDPRWNMANNVVWNQWRAPDAHIDWASETFVFDNATMKIAIHSMVFQGRLFDFGAQPSFITAFSQYLDKYYWGAVNGEGWLGHAKAFLSCNMTGLLDHYAPDARLHFVNHATGKSDVYGAGRDAIALWYPSMKDICNEDFTTVDVLAPGDALKLFMTNHSGLVIGNAAMFDWYVPGPAHGTTYNWAFDNIVFNELGKIKFHSLYWNRVPSGHAYTNMVSAPEPDHAPMSPKIPKYAKKWVTEIR